MGGIGISLSRRPIWSTVYCSLRKPQTHRVWFSCSSKLSANPDRQAREAKLKLPDHPCRTRFAPSPTGYLHLGSLRTALFNYLLAKATGGQFILRIEDTDQNRLVQDAEEKLYQDLKWSGLSWDEGPDVNGPHGTYRQSERLHLYHKHAQTLIEQGKAYRCFCAPEVLEEHKQIQNEAGQPTLYPGTCLHLSAEESNSRAAKGETFAIRFKSSKTPTVIQDIVYGNYRKKDPEDDYIIIKRDGFPTYHFANVVDDKDMKITHVIRGAEWLISTPKHVELYNAFGWQPPQFAHLGLLVDAQRQKLSKRHLGVNMSWYQDRYILPETLLNFVSLLGWRGRDASGGKKPGGNGDVMTLQDMIDNFNLKFSKGDIIVSLSKLSFLQKEHLKRLSSQLESNPTRLLQLKESLLVPFLTKLNEIAPTSKLLGDPIPNPEILSNTNYLSEIFKTIIKANEQGPEVSDQEKFDSTFHALKYLFYSIPDSVLKEELLSNMQFKSVTLLDEPSTLTDAMQYLVQEIENIPSENWNKDAISRVLTERKSAIGFVKADDESGTVTKNTWKFCRWVMLAGEEGFSIPSSMEVLGREETMKRLMAAKAVAVARETDK
ncbi:putative mitochondrial glutamyl-tRNA synthetase [Podospora fimiseda]|uniref:Glutamate--tRNA ligase, mitochondrial n=1 Tax=Podospora fimiseda TaxID=252190 RepID=A0AAN7BJZ4_9PEZI|nr:putative mitochondrial glutamyl-tRNA synthetase [Podospora fimiseda]